ncbi:MAG: hypothetical protein ACJ8AT_13700 [Hyalangium sp.]|uniref:hypothetical protein n=1 Tax=Hyalangium sp. TaxID=2028555 RepID=UPI00389A6725
MNRYIRSAALIGTCLLGVGCEQSTAPDESTFFPEAEYMPAGAMTPTTRVSGVAWDPEAFFMSIAACGPNCTMPPFLSEGIPLYQRSAVGGASVLAFDPVAGHPVGPPATSAPIGFWQLPQVPSRGDAPFFIVSTGQGSIPSTPVLPNPPFAPIPPTQYMPTLTMRPIRTVWGHCTSQEAVSVGSNGILEAVAKYLSVVKGQPTQVTDFLDPTKFLSVVVVDAFHAGNFDLRAPADSVAIEATAGQVYYIDWAPPGVPPASLRSTRGFIVNDTATTASLGIAVVLLPSNGPPPPVIAYTLKDTKTDNVARRPWVFPPVAAPPAPTIIGFLGLQAQYAPGPTPIYEDPPPPFFCLPE